MVAGGWRLEQRLDYPRLFVGNLAQAEPAILVLASAMIIHIVDCLSICLCGVDLYTQYAGCLTLECEFVRTVTAGSCVVKMQATVIAGTCRRVLCKARCTLTAEKVLLESSELQSADTVDGICGLACTCTTNSTLSTLLEMAEVSDQFVMAVIA